MGGQTRRAREPAPRALLDAVPILVVVGLVLVKCWPLIRPWDRLYHGGDFAFGIEPTFYHWLKRGVVLLWDTTLGTGSPLLGGGSHPPYPVISNLHLFYPVSLVWFLLAERGQVVSYSTLLGHHLFHYALTGALTYAYARVLALERFPAMLTAAAFVLSGFMVAHFSHWTFVDAVTWLPAILACLVRADQTDRLRWGAWAGAVLGVAALAGAPQFVLYEAFAATGLVAVLLARRVARGRPWRRFLAAALLAPAVALGLAAVQLLPAWTVATTSHRAELGFAWKANGSLPLSELFQLWLPSAVRPVLTQFIDETYFYPGVLIAVLAGYALAQRWDWRIGFHAALGLGALLLAFGEYLPAYRLAFDLVPGVSLFRIPARILVLACFAVAILGGIGAAALLDTRELGGLRRFVRGAVALTAAAAPAAYLLFLWSAAQPVAHAVRLLTDQYVLLLLVLLLVWAAVSWQARGHAPWLVRGAMLAAVTLDLGLGSLPIAGSGRPADRVSPSNRALADFLAAEPGPFRITRVDRLDPRLVYRYGFSVIDHESTFAPAEFLDLYRLIDDNPRILDLLNVRYLVRSPRQPPPVERPGDLVLLPGAVRRLPVAAPGPVRTVELVSRLLEARTVPQDAVVAVVHLFGPDGTARVLPVRAGRETAEWTVERGGDPPMAHGPAPVARSWDMPDEGYVAHSFRATWTLPADVPVAQVVLEHVGPPSTLAVEAIRLDGQLLAPPPRAYRLVRPDLHVNDAALPRAFLVPRARVVDPARMTDALRHLDPAEEVLLVEAPPAGWQAAPGVAAAPPPPARIVEYGPHRIRVEATLPAPMLLVLSDTYHPGWRAWDNGRPIPILRADHALRAVALPPGSHVVEFRYAQWTFWAGLACSGLVGIGLLVGAGVLWRPRAGAPTPP